MIEDSPALVASCRMTKGWEFAGLLRTLADRGLHPAVIVSEETGPVVRESGKLAADALSLAGGLASIAVNRGEAVAVWAPNSPEWITAALAVLASGAVLVAMDDLGDMPQTEAALDASQPRLVFTTLRHWETAGEALTRRHVRPFLLDADKPAAPNWQTLLQPRGRERPTLAGEDPGILTWTSGTTGAPKAFYLTHGNIAANVSALAKLGIIGPNDRALLPLPLHHAYPLIVGAFTALTLGTAIVLPADSSGPAILKALRDSHATAIIGVPRLYEAILAALEQRLAARAWPLRGAIGGLLRLIEAAQRVTGVRFGRIFFSPIRRSLAPHLHLLVSGGARLAETAEDRLEALGWIVLTGYGLAETASLFTGNRPGAKRRGSAGRPLAGGEIRIAAPDEQGIGEIELRGPSLTAGYLNNPEANRAGFTPDGWFKTGDLGYVDPDGFLFVTGRGKEILVLGGGKKVNPEDLEKIYGAAPQIGEIAVLEDKGALVALVRPDLVKLREIGATNIRDGVRVMLALAAQELPPYERLSGFALTDQPLPRTRLGKFRRFLLPTLYAEALAGRRVRAAAPLSEEDTALLADPTARAVWDLLRQRYPAEAVALDSNLALELNLDSFAWMELTIALQDRVGVRLGDADIIGLETVRDLLRCCVGQYAERRVGAAEIEPISEDIEHWLAPTGPFLTSLGAIIYVVNRMVMRGLFRLRVSGVEQLPAHGPFVITPNHLSDLDAMAIAAALPLSRLRQVYWAADFVRLFANAPSRLMCRTMHLFPVDERHPGAAVRTARRVLDAGKALGWFPEGWRSPDGRLQRFLPGIGQLLLGSGAPAVPAWIGGAFEALPRGRRLPRFRQVTLDFGPPVNPESLRAEGSGRGDEERVADGLRNRLIALAKAAGHPVEEAAS